MGFEEAAANEVILEKGYNVAAATQGVVDSAPVFEADIVDHAATLLVAPMRSTLQL